MNCVNLTPHSIVICLPSGDHTIPSAGIVRCLTPASRQETFVWGDEGSPETCISIPATVAVTPEELDEPSRGLLRLIAGDGGLTAVIVSSVAAPVVAKEFPGLTVLSPGTLVRGPDGQPRGCSTLQIWG